MNVTYNSVDTFVSNINKYYKGDEVVDKSSFDKVVVFYEVRFLMRLFVDWLYANTSVSGLSRYIKFKVSFSSYIKSISDDVSLVDKYLNLWIDFNKFVKGHGQLLLEIYRDCLSDNSDREVFRLFVFSIISVHFFYKWRRKRNYAIRSWTSYDNRRKKPFLVNMIHFDNMVLDRAKPYRFTSVDRTCLTLNEDEKEE